MWIPSKLTRPTRLNNAILRPRILQKLEEASSHKLILFHSPAGYGKTTIVVQWLLNHAHTAWFSIDKNDNDEFHFVNYLLQTINKACDNTCLKTASIAQRRQYTNIPALFSHLFEELAGYNKQTYIVLDDYHLIDNPDIDNGLKFFIKHIPENFTLVITSRSLPSLGIANLRVRDQLIEISEKELAFDEDEINRFFHKRLKHHYDDAQHLRILLNKAEGWPSALQLIAFHLMENKNSLADPNFSVENFNTSYLWDYLAEEVFDDLARDDQEFLMKTAILDHFNAELIVKLTGRLDALAMLEKFSRLGLFTSTLDEDTNWFRFHPLFSDFLCHQRHTLLPDISKELHANAAKIFLAQGNTELAIEHASKAEEQKLCVEILKQDGWKLLNQGELDLIETTLAHIDDELLYKEPKLLLLRAWLAQHQQKYQQVEILLDDTIKELNVRNIGLDTNSQGEYDTLRAQITINKNKPAQALQFAQKALSLLDSHSYQSRIISTAVIGDVHQKQGHLDKALSMMQQTEKISRQYQLYPQVLWALIQQGEIYFAKGQTDDVFLVINKAQKLISDQNLQQLPITEFLCHLAAKLYFTSNKLEDAEEMAYRGFEVLSTYDESQALRCCALLTKIYLAQGKMDKATYYFNHCQRILDTKELLADQDALIYAGDALISYWYTQNNKEAIDQWLENAVIPSNYNNHPNQLQGKNIVRAQMYLGYEKQAEINLKKCIKASQDKDLIRDLNHNLILDAVLTITGGNSLKAQSILKQAIELSNKTKLVSDFLLYAKYLLSPLKLLAKNTILPDAARQRLQMLLAEIKQQQICNHHYFDENFVNTLMQQDETPDILLSSPLTHREWQVLGLIYSGYSNEQISNKLEVAPTTIKTHIRNLYQKLDVNNRKQAITFAKELLTQVQKR